MQASAASVQCVDGTCCGAAAAEPLLSSAKALLPASINMEDRLLQGYHLLAAALFAPALLAAPPLLALALGIALATMVVAEVVRLAQLPIVGGCSQ